MRLPREFQVIMINDNYLIYNNYSVHIICHFSSDDVTKKRPIGTVKLTNLEV